MLGLMSLTLDWTPLPRVVLDPGRTSGTTLRWEVAGDARRTPGTAQVSFDVGLAPDPTEGRRCAIAGRREVP